MESTSTQSKVSSLINVFRGKAANGGDDAASSFGGAASSLALVAPSSNVPNKRGKKDGDGNANAPFTKLDLFDLLDE